jgi:hypothetical protein
MASRSTITVRTARVWRTFEDADRAIPRTSEKWQLVGDLGGELRALRNQADYADAVPQLDQQAAEAVAIAQRTLALLDELELS